MTDSTTESASQSEDVSNENALDIANMTVPQQRAVLFRTQGGRETAEAIVVAFVLALLFRAFIAEAFVIPTGSMAPSLMGAHKDVFCDQCQLRFPVGASLENREPVTQKVVVGGICPNCRRVNSLDLAENPDHTTFSGDRILVSKFSYALNDPKRWEVIVFKVPVNPKQNYIKRLVGLPNETLSIMHGDVYAKPTEPGAAMDATPMTGAVGGPQLGTILRKPISTQNSMSHVVYNSDFQAKLLVDSNFPSRMQPWRPGVMAPPEDSWVVEQSENDFVATVDAGADQTEWLRYFHRWPDRDQWQAAADGKSLASIDAYGSRLITDFHAYDSYLFVDARRVYDSAPSTMGVSPLKRLLGQSRSAGVFRPDFVSGGDLGKYRRALQVGSSNYANDGVHWVGDLIVGTEIETEDGCQELQLEIVEAGLLYRCTIDLESGVAKLSIADGRKSDASLLPFDGDGNADEQLAPTATTSVRAGGRHEYRFSNCDNELLLMVDGEQVQFDAPTTFDTAKFIDPAKTEPVYLGPGNPLDASPVAVGVRGGGATLHHLSINRDKYYIATKKSDYGMLDYDMRGLNNFAGTSVREQEIQAVMGEPDLWDDFPGWASRRIVSFPLEEDQFFPMGDNSPESLDARCWAGTKERWGRDRSVDPDSYKFANVSYVPRDLLVGKALAIFWPHPWRTPIPMVPNFERISLIR